MATDISDPSSVYLSSYGHHTALSLVTSSCYQMYGKWGWRCLVTGYANGVRQPLYQYNVSINLISLVTLIIHTETQAHLMLPQPMITIWQW